MVYLIIGLVIVAAIGIAFQQRRGLARGHLGYVPRALRPKVNAWYQQRGDEPPYDEDGNRINGRSLLGRQSRLAGHCCRNAAGRHALDGQVDGV